MRRTLRTPVSFAPLAALSLVGLVACAASKQSGVETCNVGADCASGICSSQGVCAPVADDAGGDTLGGDDAADSGADAANETATDAPPGDTPSVGCNANHDFVITAAELPLGPGLKATYRVATNVTVDTAGATQTDGSRKWDWSKPLAGDKSVILETSAPAGTWWASSFSSASYAVPLSTTTDLLGVFKLDGSSLSLLGIVSPTDTPASSKTNVAYAAPVAFTKFDLKLGSAWTATSNVTGTYQGVPGYFYTETYDVKVDAKGSMITPFGTFEVLRVSTLLTKQIGAVITKTRTYGYMAECFGTVAIASSASQTLDPGADFTSAAEVRRITP